MTDNTETIMDKCNDIIKIHTTNTSKFRERIYELMDCSPFYMKCFYEESPSFSNENMIDSLIWLSYSHTDKKDILDKELDNYFK